MKQIIKRIFALAMTALLLVCGVSAETGSPAVSAESAVLIEAESGDVIFEKNAGEVRPMASTTKIMTALVALESMPLETKVTIPQNAVGIEGSSVYLRCGEVLTLEELVWALMLESANDAAEAIAIAVAGGDEAFAARMNEKAIALGLNNTHFTNPHGLDNESHYTTACDLANLTRYAMQNEKFREIVSSVRHTIPLNGDEGTRVLLNHNKMLRIYEGACGVKTGFTKRSGRCLVSAAERNGVTLIAVTLSAHDDWNDHAAMLDYGFERYENVLLTMDGEQSFIMPVVGGEADSVNARNHGEIRVTLPRENQNITRVNELKSFYYAPINAGDIIGRVVYYNNGTEIASADIIAENTISALPENGGITDFISGLIKKIKPKGSP